MGDDAPTSEEITLLRQCYEEGLTKRKAARQLKKSVQWVRKWMKSETWRDQEKGASIEDDKKQPSSVRSDECNIEQADESEPKSLAYTWKHDAVFKFTLQDLVEIESIFNDDIIDVHNSDPSIHFTFVAFINLVKQKSGDTNLIPQASRIFCLLDSGNEGRISLSALRNFSLDVKTRRKLHASLTQFMWLGFAETLFHSDTEFDDQDLVDMETFKCWFPNISIEHFNVFLNYFADEDACLSFGKLKYILSIFMKEAEMLFMKDSLNFFDLSSIFDSTGALRDLNCDVIDKECANMILKKLRRNSSASEDETATTYLDGLTLLQLQLLSKRLPAELWKVLSLEETSDLITNQKKKYEKGRKMVSHVESVLKLGAPLMSIPESRPIKEEPLLAETCKEDLWQLACRIFVFLCPDTLPIEALQSLLKTLEDENHDVNIEELLQELKALNFHDLEEHVNKIKKDRGLFMNQEFIAANISKWLVDYLCETALILDDPIVDLWSTLLPSPLLYRSQVDKIVNHILETPPDPATKFCSLVKIILAFAPNSFVKRIKKFLVILLRIEANDVLSSIWEAHPKESMSALVDICKDKDSEDGVRVKSFGCLRKFELTKPIREVFIEGASDWNAEIRKICLSTLHPISFESKKDDVKSAQKQMMESLASLKKRLQTIQTNIARIQRPETESVIDVEILKSFFIPSEFTERIQRFVKTDIDLETTLEALSSIFPTITISFDSGESIPCDLIQTSGITLDSLSNFVHYEDLPSTLHVFPDIHAQTELTISYPLCEVLDICPQLLEDASNIKCRFTQISQKTNLSWASQLVSQLPNLLLVQNEEFKIRLELLCDIFDGPIPLRLASLLNFPSKQISLSIMLANIAEAQALFQEDYKIKLSQNPSYVIKIIETGSHKI